MNIAHVIPYSISYPLSVHNGRYDWVHELATRQAAQGHTVTVYGNPGSFIDGVHTTGISNATDSTRANNIATFQLAFAGEHDVYHSHFDHLHYAVASETTKPIVFTQHWWPTEATVKAAQASTAHNVWAVPPTTYMYDYDQTVGIHSQGRIYHGINLSVFQPTDTPKTDRLLFVSRISPEKQIERVIAIAKHAGAPLDIIGKIAPKNQAYWETLQPLIDSDTIRYLGPKTHAELIEYYTSACGVLFPLTEHEAFGLVAIEAQACGTPVILMQGGARPELIEDGKTGFLCADDADYSRAIASLGSLNAQDCIDFAKQFDVSTMVTKYTALYETLMKN